MFIEHGGFLFLPGEASCLFSLSWWERAGVRAFGSSDFPSPYPSPQRGEGTDCARCGFLPFPVGEGRGEGIRPQRFPLTLTLSPKGRGDRLCALWLFPSPQRRREQTVLGMVFSLSLRERAGVRASGRSDFPSP